MCEVIAAVCSETSSPNANVMTVSSRLSNTSGKPTMDVAVSVLIKLVIDMYVSMHLFTGIVLVHSFVVYVNFSLSLPPQKLKQIHRVTHNFLG